MGISGGGGGITSQNPDAGIYAPIGFHTGATTGTITLVSTFMYAVYMFRTQAAIENGDNLKFRYRITTGATGITWAEVGLYYGNVDIGATSLTLTCVGFTDVSGVVDSTGLKTTTITPGSGNSIPANSDVWIGLGAQASGAIGTRSGNVNENLELGLVMTDAARPSVVEGGSAETFSWNSNAPWWSLEVPDPS